MPALDSSDDLAQALAASCDERIRAQVAAAKQRAAQQADSRAEFQQTRAAGLRSRHAAKQARNRLAERHQEGQQP